MIPSEYPYHLSKPALDRLVHPSGPPRIGELTAWIIIAMCVAMRAWAIYHR